MDYKKNSAYLRLVRRVNELYDAVIAKAADSVGLSAREANVLAFLANNPQYDTAIEVARYRGYSKAYVSTALDALARKGLVALKTAQHDRRYQRITVLECASETVASLRAQQERFVDVIMDGVTVKERDAIAHALEKVAQNVENALSAHL